MVEAKELEHSVRRCPEKPPEFSGHEPVTIQPWLALWIFPANRTPTWQSRRRSPGARGPANTKVMSVGANKTFVEDSAGKLVKLLFFQRTQEPRTDLGGRRDVVQLNFALLAFAF